MYRPEAPNKMATTQRRLEVIDMIIEGEDRDAIILFLQDEYGLAIPSAKIEYYKARKEIKEFKKQNVDELTNLHVLRYEDLYRIARKNKWNTLAIKIMRQKEKMLQIDKKRQRKEKVNDAIEIDMSQIISPEEKLSEQRQKRLQELLNKVSKDGSK